MYVHVYSPDGELFEVPRYVADKLILEENWSQTPVTVAPVKEDDEEGSAA